MPRQRQGLKGRPERMLRLIFRSLVSGIGRLVQVFGFRCRALYLYLYLYLNLYLNLCPHPNLHPRPGTRE